MIKKDKVDKGVLSSLKKADDIVVKPDNSLNKLRPVLLDDYIGQEKLKNQLLMFMQAAKNRAEPLDHVLLYGPPGLGKTTFAHIVANFMGGNLRQTSGPALEKPGDLASLLTKLEENDVLFIDEIHRLGTLVEEILYPAMEDFYIDIILGDGVAAQSIKINLPAFTLVGATTRAGSLTSPLRDRFGIIHRLEFYSQAELSAIIKRSAAILDVKILDDGANELAKRSRGTPRIANRLLRRVRDYSEIYNDDVIDEISAKSALDLLEVDSLGLDKMDIYFLETLIKNFGGGPVGIENLAVSLNEEKITIEDVIEPYLIQQGFISRTTRGRVASSLAYEHLGLKLFNKNPTLNLEI